MYFHLYFIKFMTRAGSVCPCGIKKIIYFNNQLHKNFFSNVGIKIIIYPKICPSYILIFKKKIPLKKLYSNFQIGKLIGIIKCNGHLAVIK